jgi:hypothetical protein
MAARLKMREGRSHARQHGVLVGKPVCLDFMRTRIEDLPVVRVSTLVANGYIRRDAVTALVRFGDDGVEYGIGVRVRRFRLLGHACLPAMWWRRAAASAPRR